MLNVTINLKQNTFNCSKEWKRSNLFTTHGGNCYILDTYSNCVHNINFLTIFVLHLNKLRNKRERSRTQPRYIKLGGETDSAICTERNKWYILTHLCESGDCLQINQNYQVNWPNCCKFSGQWPRSVKSAEMKITI